jgi:hypothetical protein
MPTPFRLVALLGLCGFLAGCTLPKRAYRQVDREAPAFKAAVAAETEHQQAAGKSKGEAEKIATNKTTAQFIQREEDRRLALAAPLLQAMAALEKPRGCWAYTVTTTTTHDGQDREVVVVRYDPFQPEERIWTLVSRNGVAPDDAGQADYRARKLKAWHKTLSRQAKAKTTESGRVRLTVLSTAFAMPETASGSPTVFTFLRDRMKIPLLGDIPPSQETFTIEHEALARRTSTSPDPASLLAGTMKVDYFDSATDYAVIDPAVAPFVVKRVTHLRLRFFGKDSGAIERTEVYTDYRHVKCYEDRFETSIGTPDVMEFVPN